MTTLFFDTYTRKKREFIPLLPGKVSMYTCGPTVYDYPHIGNMRAYVFADILRRTLTYQGYDVRQVMNITDVGHLVSDADDGEDKMELSARKTGQSAWDVAKFFSDIFMRDLATLNILPPDIVSRATKHIEDQIALVVKLEKLGYTYRISDGIYFDTSKFPGYGRMTRLKAETLKPGARVAFNPEKRNPTDFALWKFSPQGTHRQMEWKSPWGIGFPGWHIECSAMAMRYLGNTLDIHTGGTDHISIHHTNEIAQSEAATGQEFARYWMHCAFLLVEGQKMSKSLGNIFTIQDLVAKGYDPLAFRYLLLTGHYRSQFNFTWKSLKAAESALVSLRSAVGEWSDGEVADTSLVEEFRARIGNDLDTPRALALLWEIAKSDRDTAQKRATILSFDRVLGLKLEESKPATLTIEDASPELRDLLLKREEFRRTKQWAEADRVRERILSLGYMPEDTPEGLRVRKISR